LPPKFGKAESLASVGSSRCVRFGGVEFVGNFLFFFALKSINFWGGKYSLGDFFPPKKGWVVFFDASMWSDLDWLIQVSRHILGWPFCCSFQPDIYTWNANGLYF